MGKVAGTGVYLRLVDGNSEAEKASQLKEAIQNPDCNRLFWASVGDFRKITGYPIAYWVSNKVRNTFLNQSLKTLSNRSEIS